MGVSTHAVERYFGLVSSAPTVGVALAAAEASGRKVSSRARAIFDPSQAVTPGECALAVIGGTQFRESERTLERIWRKGIARRQYTECDLPFVARVFAECSREFLSDKERPSELLFVMPPIEQGGGRYLPKLLLDNGNPWLDVVDVSVISKHPPLHIGFAFVIPGLGYEFDPWPENPFKRVSEETHTARAAAPV